MARKALDVSPAVVDRFWHMVLVCEHGRSCSRCCWPWQGSCTRHGYGQFAIYDPAQYAETARPSRTVRCHRFVLELTTGQPLPADVWALHACNWPRCCNPHPGHVYPGTPQQNADDRKDAALGAPSLLLPPRTPPLPPPPIPEAQISLMQFLINSGAAVSAVAELFGYPQDHIRATLQNYSRIDILTYAPTSLANPFYRLARCLAKNSD